ncbi:DUF5916 domain-containing protein [Fodinibius sediminis]|uniref:DUF5916 domain-containing protein n=1 Tax=Fodinibius sediminis TaxID=1214077 RepID=UPI00115BE6E7|nr:DUF5916 domain-containing protein [Fodinibius sediminis]
MTVIPRTESRIILDGQLKDPAWEQGRILPLTMSQPVYGRIPGGESQLTVLSSEKALYIAGHFSVSEGLGSRQLSRDDLDYSSDLFAVLIDGYNDEENAYVFITSPSGNKTDLAISDDAESPKNFNWDAFWSVGVHHEDGSWSFEIRIPFSSLQYQQEQDSVTIGLSAWKYTAANNQFDTYPRIKNDYGINSYFKPSRAADFSFFQEKASTPLFISPYLLGGYGRKTVGDGPPIRRVLLDAGGDVKYRWSSNFTLDATVNTDFAQVEGDDHQVNLSRFAIYRDEKRAFFQERAGLFSFNTGGPTRLFYSRRIGLTNDGRQVPLYGGFRLTGRSNGWDVGLLTMQSAPKYGLESENFGVLRIRKKLDESTSSYVGMISTSRIARDGTYNIAYGADAVWEVPRDIFFTGRYAHTLSDPSGKSYARGWLNNTNLLLSVQRRSRVGFFYTFSVNRVGRDYSPGLGFLDRWDFTRYGDRMAYGWVAPESSVFQKIQLIADAFVYTKNTGNEIESSSIGLKNYISFKSGFSLQFGLKRQTEKLYEGYPLSPAADIPAGGYRFGELFLTLSSGQGRAFRFNTTTSVGSYFDGRGIAGSFSPEWTINSNIELSGELEYYNIRFQKRSQHYKSLLIRGRLDFKPVSRMAVSGLAQYSKLTRIFSSFARLRFNIVDGADLFLVYKHGRNSSPLERIRNGDFTGIHSVRAKFSYTFRY